MRFRSVWCRIRSVLATFALGGLLAAPVVLLPAAPVEAHCGCHGTLCSGVGTTIDHCLGEISNLKDEVASKAAEITRQANIISDVISIVNGIKSKIESIIGTLSDLALRVADIALMIPDFFFDLVTFISGFHPNALYGTIVDQLDEGACHDLPAIVNTLDLSALPDFPFKEILPSSIFSLDLPDLVGIEPRTATSDDLLRFKTLTDTPIQMLLDMTELPYKLPVGFAAALSQFCIDSTELYLDQADEAEALRMEIHHGLALGSGRERHGGESVNALHQLPAAFGGILEEVRWVLGETVDQFVAAGERIDHHVSREIDRGDASFGMNRFREAYGHYQNAYARLTRREKGHDRDDD